MIDILLATYNGEKYLELQIQSIISQSWRDWRLLIHDDGSLDGTKEIIRKYTSSDSRIIHLDDGITHLGPGGNFFHLMKKADADYVCFCDQDDFWFPHKLEKMVNLAEQKDSQIPFILFSDSYSWLPECSSPVGTPVVRYPNRKLRNFFFLNGGIQGCACLFNKKLLDAVRDFPGYIPMHDQLISLYAASFGQIFYLNDKLFLYRQHQANATAHIKQSKLSSCGAIFSGTPVIERSYYNGIKSFYDVFRGQLSSEQKKLFSDFLAFPSEGRIFRFFSILSNRYTLYGSICLLLVKTLFKKLI